MKSRILKVEVIWVHFQGTTCERASSCSTKACGHESGYIK